MSNREIDKPEQLDRATSTTICKVIGDRLRQDLVPEPSTLPAHLQHLMEKLRLQDIRNRP